jgi:Zn finger protein HypA/HybF involved in hydrogenase expression
MITIRISCKSCERKTRIVAKVNHEEDSYYCPVCGSADTLIEEVK